MLRRYTDARARLAELNTEWQSAPYSRAEKHRYHRATLVALPVFLNLVAGDSIGERERLAVVYRRLLRNGAKARWRSDGVWQVVLQTSVILTGFTALCALGAGAFVFGEVIHLTVPDVLAPLVAATAIAATAGLAGAVYILTGMLVATRFDRKITRYHQRDVAFHAAAIAFTATVDHAMPDTYMVTEICRRLRRMDKIQELPTRQLQAVFADRFQQAADAVLATTLWVALPNENTHAELQRFLATLMRTLIYQAYDHLPLAPPVTPVARRRAVLSVVRTVAIGLFPGVALLTAHFAGVDLAALVGDGVLATAKTVAILWAVVTFLILIDPNLKERLDTVKNVKGLFSGSKPGD